MYSIYKIVCKDISIKSIYVGSTINFKNRQKHHKAIHQTKNRPIYQTIRENGGWDNWSMIEIETLECSKEEARMRERHWCETLNADLNMIRPIISEDELREGVRERSNNHYQENIEEIRARHNAYNTRNKEYFKNWREEHREEQREKRRIWREANRDKINEKKRLAYHRSKMEN